MGKKSEGAVTRRRASRIDPCQRGRRRQCRASPCGRAGASTARPHERRPRRPCHYRAIHSGPGWCPADNHGQRHSDLDLRCFLQSQLTNRADLALRAGGRRELSRPSIRTTLKAFWRLLKVVCWQSAGTRLWKETQEPVCAGGRDRFRTCGLCRVRERGPHTHQFGTPRRTISVQVNEPAEPRPRGAACGITRQSFWQIPGKPCRNSILPGR